MLPHSEKSLYAERSVFRVGAFDIVAELWPHLTMILYRLRSDRHSLMYRLFLGTSVAEITGTTFETLVVFWLWGTLWQQWTLPFKIVTPILHALFSSAQLFGAWIFWQLAKKEKAMINAVEIDLCPRIGRQSKGISDESSRQNTSTQ